MGEAAIKFAEDGAVQALTFDISGEIFALEAGVVREILDLLPETDIPGAPAFVGAVINFRGRVIPLVDLRLAFEDDPSNHAMYVAVGVPCVYIHSGYYE